MRVHKASIALATIIAALAGASAFDGASAGFGDGRYGYFGFAGGFISIAPLSRTRACPVPHLDPPTATCAWPRPWAVMGCAVGAVVG